MVSSPIVGERSSKVLEVKLKRSVLFPTPESPIINSLNKYSNSASPDDVVAIRNSKTETLELVNKNRAVKKWSSLRKRKGRRSCWKREKGKKGSKEFLDSWCTNLVLHRETVCRRYQPCDYHVAWKWCYQPTWLLRSSVTCLSTLFFYFVLGSRVSELNIYLFIIIILK